MTQSMTTPTSVTRLSGAANSIPDANDAAALMTTVALSVSYNSSQPDPEQSSPRFSTMLNEEAVSTISDDLMSIHSTKTDSFMVAEAIMAPALPAKSARRTSRLLATMPDKLAQDRPVLTAAAPPHLMYLSSEEDASSSADDFSDFDDFSSDGEDSGSDHSRKNSYQDIARVVPVIFSGKPSMITLAPRSRSQGELALAQRARHLHRTSTDPTLYRERSDSNASSSFSTHPPRISSFVTGSMQPRRGAFLKVDPFAVKPEPEDAERPKTPKTPTAMFKKTLNLVKKRSKPSLNTTLPLRDTEVTRMEKVGEVEENDEYDVESRASEETKSATEPVSYHEIMKLAKRNAKNSPPTASPPSPPSPNSSKDRIFSGLSMSKRMSVRV